MAVTAQAGVFSWGPQADKGTVAATFYQHRAGNIDLAPISDDRLGPPEVGGLPTPTFPYRAGVMAVGGATLYPRLENTFGWLLEGVSGAWSVTTNQDVLDNTVTSFYHHEFTFATNAGYVPWMSFRKLIPGSDAGGTDKLGETFIDCKAIGLALALSSEDPISARIDVLGRTPEFSDGTAFTYSNTEFESYESIPVGCVLNGYLKVPGFSATELPVTAANVTIANQPLDVRQEKVYGSPYLEDVTIIGRQFTVDMVVKWTDPQLYRDILTGSTTGTAWSPSPWVEDLDILALSAEIATGTTPWQLRIEAAEVMYQVVGGIRLAANNAVMMRIQGTAIAPSSGNYYTIHLGNEHTTYTWPI